MDIFNVSQCYEKALDAATLRQQVISNNIANVNTYGGKKVRAEFQDLIYQTLRDAGAQSGQDNQYPTGLQIGLGTRVAATQRVITQGPLQTTENILRYALDNGLKTICVTDHYWDETIPGASGWYAPQNTAQLCTIESMRVPPRPRSPWAAGSSPPNRRRTAPSAGRRSGGRTRRSWKGPTSPAATATSWTG